MKKFVTGLAVVVAMLVFAVGCSKMGAKSSGGNVTLADLYKESIHASIAYAKGEASYKPSREDIHVSARKYSEPKFSESANEAVNVEGMAITATGKTNKGDMLEFHVSIPLEWLQEGSKEFANLDNEINSLADCMVKAGANEAANPLTDKNTCKMTSLTYNGHPGATMSDPVKAPHMEAWLYSPEQVTKASNE